MFQFPTDNAERLFKLHYAFYEEESWAKASQRVAEFVARGEVDYLRWANTFYEEISQARLMPGGRIWYGAGRPVPQLLNCFHKDTPVVTEAGIKSISSIEIGERVLTEDGTFQKVLNKFSQGHRKSLLTIKVDRFPDVLKVTPDHKILTKDGWKEAKDLTEKDYIAIPGVKDSTLEVPKEIKILDFIQNLPGPRGERVEIDGKILRRSKLRNGKVRKDRPEFDAQIKAINARIPVSIDLAKLMGYYISEGCASSNGHTVIFTYSCDEEEYAQETLNLVESLFGIKGRIDKNQPTWIQVIFSSRTLNAFMKEFLGASFDKKMLPWWVFNTSREFKTTVLAYTCRGDAHTNLTTGSTLLTMCNPTSMLQMYFLAQDLGLNYSVKFHQKKKDHYTTPVSLMIAASKTYSQEFKEFSSILGKFDAKTEPHYRKVSGVCEEPYDDLVWDISVENNHSLQIYGLVGSNCFVCPSEDSREGWARMVGENIIIAGTGGGNGENYGNIRPRGADIRGTGGKATGAVSIMRIENSVLTEIRNGSSRRAARMMALPINHPDTPEFLEAKLDRNELTNANCSTIFMFNPEEFFEKVRNDEPFEFIWGNEVWGTMSARELWEKIIRNSLEHGEPGILNGFLANQQSNLWYCRTLVSTNPCVTGDTVIATVDGPRTFKELADKGDNVLVYSWHPETKKPVIRMMVCPRVTRKNTKILEVEFDSGLKVRCTPDHNFYSFRGKKVQAQHLKIGSSIRAFSMSQHRDGHLRVHGWDSTKNKADHQWVARMMWEAHFGLIPEGKIIHHVNENPRDNRIDNLIPITPLEHNSEHYSRREEDGFHHPSEDKNHAIERVKNHKVVGIREAGFEDVYNGTVDDSHSYIILDPQPVAGEMSGIVSANCGEIWLQPYGNCCLASIVLPHFVKEFSKSNDPRDHLDWEALHHTVTTGIRFLDNVLDVTHYPFQALKEESMLTRRVGLGVIGVHYMLLHIGLKYSSQEGRDFCDKVATFIKNTAYDASINLALEKGVFPLFDQEKIMKSGFIQSLKPSMRNKIKTYGLRNCALLNIAPTGTTSMVLGMGNSSGIQVRFADGTARAYREGEQLVREVLVCPLLERFVLEGKDTSHFETAENVSLEDQLKMQATWQKHFDNAISITLNIPKGKKPSMEEYSDLLMKYIPILKGLTVYPEGSRTDEPLIRVPRLEVIKDIKNKKLIHGLIEEVQDCPDGLCSI